MGRDRAGLNRSVITNQDASDPQFEFWKSHTSVTFVTDFTPKMLPALGTKPQIHSATRLAVHRHWNHRIIKNLQRTIKKTKSSSPRALSNSSKFSLLFIFQVPSKLGIFSSLGGSDCVSPPVVRRPLLLLLTLHTLSACVRLAAPSLCPPRVH